MRSCCSLRSLAPLAVMTEIRTRALMEMWWRRASACARGLLDRAARGVGRVESGRERGATEAAAVPTEDPGAGRGRPSREGVHRRSGTDGLLDLGPDRRPPVRATGASLARC